MRLHPVRTGDCDDWRYNHAAKAGDFIGYRKGGLAHTIVNTGEDALRCIIVGERLPHDVGDYPRLKKRIYRHAGLRPNVVDHEHIDRPAVGAKTRQKARENIADNTSCPHHTERHRQTTNPRRLRHTCARPLKPVR